MKGSFGGGFAIIGIPLLALVMDPLTAGALLAPLFVMSAAAARSRVAPSPRAWVTLSFLSFRYGTTARYGDRTRLISTTPWTEVFCVKAQKNNHLEIFRPAATIAQTRAASPHVGTFADANRTPPPCIVDLRGIARPAAHAVTLRGTSKAGSESATSTSDVLSDTPMTRSAKGSGGDAFPGVIDSTSDIGRGSNDDPDSSDHGSFSVNFGDIFGDDDDDLPGRDADEHELGFRATSQEYDALDVDLSPWAPLLGMLDSTDPEGSPDDRPFTPGEGAERAHALELRAESMLQYSERGAQRTGELDRTEVGVSDDNRDVVAGRDEVEIDGMLEEHTGHGLVHVANEVEMNVGGRLHMHAHLEDNIIMGGVMTDEWKGGTFITAAMSDDMAAGLGLRCTAPLDVWVHGLMGMEERPGTCAADGVLFELAGTLYEREYGPSAHVALVARHSGTVVTTMKTGFRPLMKTALGVRNLIPGGGGGDASASPPAAPPTPAPRSPRSPAAASLPTVSRLRSSTSGRAGGSSSHPRSPAAPRRPRTTPPRG